MQPSLQHLYDKLEAQKKELLKSLEHLTTEQLNAVAAEGKWSVAQILSHIIAAEKMSLKYIQKKLQGVEEASDTGVWEEMKMVMLKISQRLPGIKFRAPQKVIDSTMQYGDFDKLSREWDQVRMEFRSQLEMLPERHMKKKIYRHIRAGYLNIGHCLEFFREHIIHHTPQIKKLTALK